MTQELELEKYITEIGFIDITETEPFHFIECMPVTWDNLYVLKKRFRRVRANKIITGLSVGIDHLGITHIIINSYYKDCYSRFCEQLPLRYVLEFLKLFIEKNEMYVQRLCNKDNENLKK